jgi:cysteine-rich repeat protein
MQDGSSTSSSGVGPTGSVESGGTSEGSGPIEDACGNGLLEAGEVCDDGNELDADGCNRDCRPSGEMLFELVFDTSALGSEQVNDIDHASDGTYVLGGQVAGAGQDAWAARLTADDELMWNAPLVEGTYDDAIFGVAAAEGGDVYVAGVVDLLAGAGDGWVAALQPTGTVVATDRVESPYHGRFMEIEDTGAGLIAVGHEDDPAGTRGLVRRYDYDLVMLAETEPVAASMGLVLLDVCSHDGRALVEGFRPAPSSFVEGLIAFLDADALQWLRTSQAQETQHSYKIACAVAGDRLWSAGYDTAATPKWLATLVSHTLDGEAADDAATYVGELDLGAFYSGLASDAEGNLIVGGGTVTGPAEIDYAPIVRKFDPSGALLWSRALPASGFPLGSILAVDVSPEGDIRVAGYATDTAGTRHRYLARFTP